jgi:hypothetical protein
MNRKNSRKSAARSKSTFEAMFTTKAIIKNKQSIMKYCITTEKTGGVGWEVFTVEDVHIYYLCNRNYTSVATRPRVILNYTHKSILHLQR